ncbi:MAG: methylenetetrahydrofolate reductase [Dehalococcoidia bacterium]|nr:methylenetetrahydrofolate reductase [Dehalococcoidia bacterium]
MGSFADALASGKFLVTAEVNPPKGVDLTKLLADVALLKPHVDAVNVTDQSASAMRMGAIGVAARIRQMGIEPILQVTCRDRNRIALQADLLAAVALGVENILCLTGDPVGIGDHPNATPVFDIRNSSQLLEVATTLMRGHDLSGNALLGAPRFVLGAATNPGVEDMDAEARRAEDKVQKGACFLQSQAVFEPDVFIRFMQRLRHLNAPVLAGVILLKSAAMARHMNEHVPGIRITEAVIEEMDRATDRVAASVAIAARTIAAIRPYCRGVHIMAIGWERYIPTVLEKAGLASSGSSATVRGF